MVLADLSPHMQRVRVMVDVSFLLWVELENGLVVFPEHSFDLHHFIPGGAAAGAGD